MQSAAGDRKDTMTTTTPSTATRDIDGRTVPAAGTYTLDVSHTDVGFSARHLMVSKVKGRFTDFGGTVVIADDPTQSSVEVEIRTASIHTRDTSRDEHLRSPDFLDVEQYPAMTYRSTSVTPVGDTRWEVAGELTIRDITRSVDLAVEFEGAALSPYGVPVLGFSAEAEIDREGFGLTWNVPLETGGVLVGKQVKILIEAELNPAD
jgi:polyisoprenoid-binding protein YceI